MAVRPGAKLFYKIGEVSALTGVEPYVLRYWESEFPTLAPRKGRGGQRVYQQKDIELVFAIKTMLHEEGYTIAGARARLAKKRKAEPGRAEAVAQPEGGLTEALARIREDIKDILSLLK